MDGEDRNDSREVLTRTSHTTGEEITSGSAMYGLGAWIGYPQGRINVLQRSEVQG
jgi:hypothetical protein